MSPKKLVILLLGAVALPACGAVPSRKDSLQQPSVSVAASPEAEALARRGKGAAAAGDNVRAEQYLAFAIERGASERHFCQSCHQCASSPRATIVINSTVAPVTIGEIGVWCVAVAALLFVPGSAPGAEGEPLQFDYQERTGYPLAVEEHIVSLTEAEALIEPALTRPSHVMRTFQRPIYAIH